MSGSWMVLAPALPLLVAALFHLCFAHRLRGAGRALCFLSLLAAGSGILLLAFLSSRRETAFGGMLRWDALAAAAGLAVLASAGAALALAPGYFERRGIAADDAAPLVLFAASGLLLLCMAQELLTALLALETASLALYALAGYDHARASSAEAALKYFLPGGVASAVLLYGTACLYGATGSTRIGAPGAFATPLALVGAAMVLGGLAFKAGLVPFHGWLPDVYAGSPSPVTGFMAAAVKAGAFAVLARFAVAGMPGERGALALGLLALFTMVFGNLAGLAQTGLKRLLAYSAIAHSGYLLVGVAAAQAGGSLRPVGAYLLAYALLTVGAFAAAGILEDPATGGLEIAQMRGLYRKRPFLALALAFCLLGLAGFPPAMGFLAKVSLFSEAYARGLVGLVVVAVLCSVAALGYYLKPVLAMFMQEPAEGAAAPWESAPAYRGASALAFACGAGGIVLGCLPALWL